MKSSKVLRCVACASFVLALGGCSKLLSSVGIGGADGGAAASSGLSLSGLEGEIDIAGTSKQAGKPDKTVNVALQVKGNKFRADLPTGIEGAEKLGHVYGIIDSDAKKADIVIDNQKEVVELDLNKIGDQVKSMQGPAATTKPGTPEPPKYPPKITKTGTTDTVAGYSCEIWDIASTEPGDKSKADVCVAQQGVSWFHLPMTGAPAEYAALGELADGSHFPLRAVVYAKDGTTEQGRVEVTKIDKKSLDASLFTPPPSYKVVDLQAAIQGFMAASMGQAGGMPGGAGGFGGPGGAGGFAGHPPPHALPPHH